MAFVQERVVGEVDWVVVGATTDIEQQERKAGSERERERETERRREKTSSYKVSF